MPLSKPSFSREHRLGLVVYGGISLAIYMNGVCQEFYNAVRGRGIYKLIKALTDADIVIDIISGTSAGGINGVLLSYALANSDKNEEIKINFKECSDIWLKNGDIQKLFWKKDDLSKKHITSLFDGDVYFRNEIEETLKALWNNESKMVHDEWVSDIEELDLYVTGTDILGRIHQTFDNTGCVIEIKDHRAVFHLKYRQGSENDFSRNETVHKALAKLCQITACFPIAFPPVTVSLDDIASDEDNKIDKKLVRWGELKKNRFWPLSSKEPKEESVRSKTTGNNTPRKGRCLHFFDGGILDNRPFTHTIKEIYQRTAKRPVFRKLFYVDPSPDHFQNSRSHQESQKPNALEVVISALRIPSYDSIDNDLELIKEHNEKVRRYKSMMMDVENFLEEARPDDSNADIYDKQRDIYLRTRLVSIKDKLLPLIFIESEDPENNQVDYHEKRKKLDLVAEILAKPFTDPQELSDRIELLKIFYLNKELKINYELSRSLDIDFTLRKYFFVAEYIYKLLDENFLKSWLSLRFPDEFKDKGEKELKNIKIGLEKLIKEINKNIQELKDIQKTLLRLFACQEIEAYFLGLLQDASPRNRNKLFREFPDNFYRVMLWLHAYFLEASENEEAGKIIGCIALNDRRTLQEKLDKTKKEVKNSNGEPISGNLMTQSGKSYLNKLDQKTKKVLEIQDGADKYIRQRLLNYFTNFEEIDAFLYPLDYWAGISEKQLIEVHRICPKDAGLGFSTHIKENERLDKKLAGNNLYSFGGFLKETWRANDILWGRLDGLNRIAESIITKNTVKNFAKLVRKQISLEGNKLSEAEYIDKLLNESFLSQPSHAKPKDEKRIERLRNLLQKQLERLFILLDRENENSKYTNINDDEELDKILEKIRRSLVFVGQIDILHHDKELDKILAFPKDGLFKRLFMKGMSYSLMLTSGAVNTDSSTGSTEKSLFSKEQYFKRNYKVGSEELKSIPKQERRKISKSFVQISQAIIQNWQVDNRLKVRNKSLEEANFLDSFNFFLLKHLVSLMCFALGFCVWFLTWLF